MTTVWLVEKRGVYSHGILGVFATEHEACACAEKATSDAKPSEDDVFERDDGDGHHEFVLMRCELGHAPEDVATWKGRKEWSSELGYHLAEPYSWRPIGSF